MLAPIRRFLGERIVQSPRHCRVCIRTLHNQHVVRGPAAAEAQVAEDYIPALKSRFESQKSLGKAKSINLNDLAKRVPQIKGPSPTTSTTKVKPPPAKKTKKSKHAKAIAKSPTTQGKNARPIQTDPTTGQFGFDLQKVRATYQAPDEKTLPRQIEYTQRRHKMMKTYKVDYDSQPLRYIEEGLKLRTKIEFAQMRQGGYRVRLAAIHHKETVIAMGDGQTKVFLLSVGFANEQQLAADAAALHLLYREAPQRVFQEALLLNTVKPLSRELINENKSSKVDVYDYAAQFNVLPDFKLVRIPADSSANCKMGYFVRVTVTGTEIFGVGFHPSTNAFAEIAACVDFKRRAEERHQGEKMMVKHINTLTSKTGKKFLEYSKMKTKDWEQYNFTSRSISGWEISGTLHLGDRLLSQCVMFTYPPFRAED